MLNNVLKSYRRIYQNPLNSTTIQQKNNENIKNTYDFDKNTEFFINRITPDSSFRINKKKSKIKNSNKNNTKNNKQIIKEKKDQQPKHEHKNCSSCAKCHPYFRMLKKERKKLVDFINSSKIKNIKLIGNNRYNDASPKKYVYDNNRQVPGRKLGIIPLPLNKRKKNLSVLESINYHDLQRSIVMMRRIQYDRKLRKGQFYNYLDDVIFIQRWWKELKNGQKALIIQRAFRCYLKRKKFKLRNNLKENSTQIINILNKIIYKKPFNKIKKCRYMKLPRINTKMMRKITKGNNYYYSNKIRNILSISSINKIKSIQNNYRIYLAMGKKNDLFKGKKNRPLSKKPSIITKMVINEDILNDKINMLQKNIRLFLYEKKKKYVIKINNIKENYGIYIDKIYLNNYNKKIIEFNKKLRHAMQKIALKKKTKYKNIKDYNINDIYKISKIQRIYKIHYNKYHINKKDLIKIYSNKTFINCFISKTRMLKNNKILLLIQKAFKSTLKKIRFEKNIIKNKPKSLDFNKNNNDKIPKLNSYVNNNNVKNKEIIKNSNEDIKYLKINKQNISTNKNDRYKNEVIYNDNNISINGKETNKNQIIKNNVKTRLKENKNRRIINLRESTNILNSREKNRNYINYNLVYCFTKKYVINVNKQLIILQKAIKSYLYIKKAKKEYYNIKNCLYIKKININKIYFISKKHANELDCINKIIEIQRFYKTRFNYLKNNIIKFTISTDRDDELKVKLVPENNTNLNLAEKKDNNKNISKYNKNNNIYIENNLIEENQEIIRKPNKNNATYINTLKNNSFKIEKNNIKSIPKLQYKRKSFQIGNNRFILLSYLVDKNRKPIQQVIGNYYQKIRVKEKIYQEFINTKNKCYKVLNKSNRGIYISKKIYINNDSKIKLIQKKIKNHQILKKIKKEKNIAFKRPLNKIYIIFEEKINDQKNINYKNKNKSNSNFNKDNAYIKEKDKNKIKFINTSKEFNSNDINNEEDSYFDSENRDFGDLIGEKIYTVYNKNKIIHHPHLYMNNYYYMTKIRIYKGEGEEEISSQKEYDSIKKELKKRREDNKIEDKKNNSFYLSYSNSSFKKNRISTLNNKEIIKCDDEIFSFRQKEKEKKENIKPFNTINNKCCYIEKIRFRNSKTIKSIKNCINNNKSNKKENNGTNVNNKKMMNNININKIYIKPINYNCFISKKRKKNGKGPINLKESRNNGSLLNEIKINNSSKKMKIIDKNNFMNNDSIIMSKNNFNNYSSSIKNNNISNNNMNIIDSNNYKLNRSDSNSYYSNCSRKISNGNNIVTSERRNGKYKIKKKRTINNININNKVNYFHNKVNYINFFQLLNLFIVKNTQQNIFYILFYYYLKDKNKTKSIKKYINLYNNSHFKFPFYIFSLQRIFNYIKYENKQNKRINIFLNSIFPSLNKNKSFYYLLICLNFENKKKLINTNLYNVNEEKNILIEFLNDFSKFDKQMYNKELIIDKINKTKFYNTNIFTLIKFLDEEFNKLENISDFLSNGSDEENMLNNDLNESESKSGKIAVNYFIDEKDKNIKYDDSNIEVICIKKRPKSKTKNRYLKKKY